MYLPIRSTGHAVSGQHSLGKYKAWLHRTTAIFWLKRNPSISTRGALDKPELQCAMTALGSCLDHLIERKEPSFAQRLDVTRRTEVLGFAVGNAFLPIITSSRQHHPDDLCVPTSVPIGHCDAHVVSRFELTSQPTSRPATRGGVFSRAYKSVAADGTTRAYYTRCHS